MQAQRVTVRVEQASVEVELGGWSELVPLSFALDQGLEVHGVVRFHLAQCDEEDVRLLVPAISVDPHQPPPWSPISAPAEFAAEIAHGLGKPFDTLGWAALTNPLKDQDDSHLSPQAFFDHIELVQRDRRALLDWGLSQDDWEVYYQSFSSPDRVGHMFFKDRDAGHPLHDPESAASEVQAWGQRFALRDAIEHSYRAADRIVGDVLDRVQAGAFGDDCLLLVFSDHGMQSFRWGVNLNNLLHEAGLLTLRDGMTPAEAIKGGRGRLLHYVDWERTTAYSMGLGKVFVNLAGREPEGIVRAHEYRDVVREIQQVLFDYRGPRDETVIVSADWREDLFHGPWWKEGSGTRVVRGESRDVEHDGFADVFVGFAPNYRVSWGNTMGDIDRAVVVDNSKTWSGDHVSLDPEHVRGVLLSNRPFDADMDAGIIDIGPTVLTRYGLDPTAADMDGRALPFAPR